ncbi:uncharacterized protein LOC127865316 isoform X1 [Dreissena polymorpha]|uniref:VDE lipocalin domain-containing protein n=2 Tax=Dreissena polymorpha TaxID=45954 RepID=A0A9D4RSR9_DREPO|nr:uncharacterized protein LOC127865316 isoform X1 [Dreissena polymorpha]KAH3877232.1 hypothetical protein DPMN_001094 [Dreissena polymorpha]
MRRSNYGLMMGHGVNAKSNPDVLCIAEHCGRQSAACVTDADCRHNMECMTKCGLTNHKCMYECMNTYEDEVFDAFMKCMVDDNHCMTLTPPDPAFRCSPPVSALGDFNLSELTGRWYIVLGLNRDYDCFDCQITTYKPTPNSSNYTLTELYDVVMLNGSTRHMVATQQVAQLDPLKPAVLDYTNHLMGITMYEKWQIVDVSQSGTYLIVYYCGHMSADWWYEGNLVYYRQPTISPEDYSKISDAVRQKIGHDVGDYCRPRTTSCSYMYL